MSVTAGVPLPRCCPEHHDWATLARHLLADFMDAPTAGVVRELWQARRAVELFSLELADALSCAELIVRHRVISACHLSISTTARTQSALVKVA